MDKKLKEKTLTDAQAASLVYPTEKDFLARDRRQCDCELTYVHRKHHAALGTGIEIKLCCMAKFIESEFGLPEGTFLFAMDFLPTWEWDCDQIHEKTKNNPDGSQSTEYIRLGNPPVWLKKRMDKKSIKIKNFRPENDGGEVTEG